VKVVSNIRTKCSMVREMSKEELENRRKSQIARGESAFTPEKRDRVISKALRAYANIVTSADKGAVRII